MPPQGRRYIPLKPVEVGTSGGSGTGEQHGRKRHAARGVRRRAPVVHLALRAAAHPGLPVVHLRAVARRDARRRAARRGGGRGGGRGARPPTRAARDRLASLAFILGFSLVFVALGASASAIGQFLMAQRSTSSAGSPAPSSSSSACTRWACCASSGCTRRSGCRRRSSARPASSARCWSAWRSRSAGRRASGRSSRGILAVAATQDTVGDGVRLLSAYSLGLGVPFFATALAINRFFAAFAKIRRHYHKIELVSGRPARRRSAS